MNGFSRTFHDLRHAFATMMIGNGRDARTVASYLGHASVFTALYIYADVDPDAKRAAVGKVDKSFDLDMGSPALWKLQTATAPAAESKGLAFTVAQLEAMLTEARRMEADHGGAWDDSAVADGHRALSVPLDVVCGRRLPGPRAVQLYSNLLEPEVRPQRAL